MAKELSEEQKDQILRLRSIRENLGYSQEQFADIADISISVYKKIESYERRISFESLQKIHRNINVSVDYILFGDNKSVSDVWINILNCTDEDKMLLFLRMYHYFVKNKVRVFPTEDMQSMDIEKLSTYVNNLQNVESIDAT